MAKSLIPQAACRWHSVRTSKVVQVTYISIYIYIYNIYKYIYIINYPHILIVSPYFFATKQPFFGGQVLRHFLRGQNALLREAERVLQEDRGWVRTYEVSI